MKLVSGIEISPGTVSFLLDSKEKTERCLQIGGFVDLADEPYHPGRVRPRETLAQSTGQKYNQGTLLP